MIRIVSFLVVLSALLLHSETPQAAEPPQRINAEAKTIKVGIIDLDNYHAVALTELFHNPKAAENLTGLKVVAAFPAFMEAAEESKRQSGAMVKLETVLTKAQKKQ